MKNNTVGKQHVLDALDEIDKIGIDKKRQSTKYDLCRDKHDQRRYPPKYALSIASRFATGIELEANNFYGGKKQTNLFLQDLGFTIKDKNGRIQE